MKYVLVDLSTEEWNKFKSRCAINGISIKDRVNYIILKDIEGDEGNDNKNREEIQAIY